MLRIFTHPAFYRHDTGVGHPESGERLRAALDGVQRAGLESTIVTSQDHPDTDRIIARVHSADYQRSLEQASMSGQRLFHSLDNPISNGSYAAARTAVAIALDAASQIWTEGKTSKAFVIARPPGHHALKNQAMGFCFFNTIACVADWLLEREELERIFILDWDVHHGNGTQELFEDREDVFYASLHRYPFYPGTGSAAEIGVGLGRGCTLNIPLEGATGDAPYLRAFERSIIPAIDAFAPDAILISAGFDAHYRDPLGGMRVTEEGFAEMTRMVVDAASRHGGGKLLSLLEGGYDPEGLASSVQGHLIALGE